MLCDSWVDLRLQPKKQKCLQGGGSWFESVQCFEPSCNSVGCPRDISENRFFQSTGRLLQCLMWPGEEGELKETCQGWLSGSAVVESWCCCCSDSAGVGQFHSHSSSSDSLLWSIHLPALLGACLPSGPWKSFKSTLTFFHWLAFLNEFVLKLVQSKREFK